MEIRGLGLAAALLAATLVPGKAETPRDKGRYLAAIAACIGCHTPRAPGAALLSGGVKLGAGPSAGISANITPDRATGIGAWSNGEIVTAIREGRRPDGSKIGPPMPRRAYAGLTDEDVDAIVAFLRSVPPVRNVVDRPKRDEARPSSAERAPEPVRQALPRGRYLFAVVAHCGECHARQDGAPGKAFQTPHGPVLAPALSPALLTGLTDADLARLVTAGTRPDGSHLAGPMPVAAYAQLTPGDLAAIIGYLREPAR